MKLKLWRSLLLGLCLSNAIASQAYSQISPDGTTNTTVNSTDNTITIDSGDRAGDNLFHSFEQFDLPSGSEAFFNNQSDIANIFSRVTGGDISQIEGLIRANGNASLFLINPAGIVFGEGAALDIGGSFTASTAESIVFNDDVEFNAQDTRSDSAPLLTINQPVGLNYGNSPGNIAINGSSLSVNNGETLALLGGNVTITGGQISAPGGNIELGGLTAAEQVNIQLEETNFNSISFPEGVERGDITLTNGAEANVKGAGGGNIRVNARNLELSGGELGESNLSAGIATQSRSPQAQAGNITIASTNNITVNQGSFISNNLEEFGTGNAGGINIATDNLSLTQGSQINSSTFGQGNGGAITIEALDTISIDGVDADGFSSDLEGETTPRSGIISIDGETEAEIPSGIFSQVRQGATGDGGEIDITTDNLSLIAGGKVDASTLGVGDAGRITIEAAGDISADGESLAGIIPSGIFSQVRQGATGDGGEIDITTANLSLSGGSRVSSTIFGQGNGGAITVRAAGDISADGESLAGVPGGILSIVLNGATGDGGEIDITTTNLSLSGGSQVSTTTFGQGDGGAITVRAAGDISADGASQAGFPSGISSIVFEPATGNSGDIDITTANLSLRQGGGVSASTLGVGDGGAITIDASDTIFASGSGITFIEGINIPTTPSTGIFTGAADSGRGNSADISINTSSLFLTNGAGISTQSLGQGNAGNLSIQAGTVALSNGAALFASTPVGTGGNINLQIAESLILQENSTVSAQALENANGGNIDLEASFVIAFSNQNSDIIASAGEGTGGNINVTTNALFGLEERSSMPPNNTNDLDASSEFGLDGAIQINELDINPIEALEELPLEVIDVAGSVEQNLCQQGQGSEFVVTGKGGTASSPAQAREGSVSEVDLVQPVPLLDAEEPEQLESAKDTDEEVVEAQGWVVNDRGMVELVARKTDIDSSPAQPEPQCHQ